PAPPLDKARRLGLYRHARGPLQPAPRSGLSFHRVLALHEGGRRRGARRTRRALGRSGQDRVRTALARQQSALIASDRRSLMKIAAKAEYACLAILALARCQPDDPPLRIREIAEEHGIPERYLVQILLQLKGAGLVVSVRGALGGYRLARPPDRISLGE